ncbi:MAG: HD-GYP domain-containing protein [Chloroflexi bacterium]|nr:HD-GYP domain-containing protein [Chloroflexota bacterium]
MRVLPLQAQVFVGTVTLLAGAILFASLPPAGPVGWTAETALAVVLGVVAFTAARIRPVDLSHTIKFNLCASVAFAALLAVGQVTAIWIAALGMVVATVLPRWGCPCRWYQMVFNAATYVLSIAAAGFVYAPFDRGFPLLRTPENGLGLLLAALTFFLVNAGLMTAIVGLVQQQQEFLSGWLIRVRQLAPLYGGLLVAAAVAVVVFSYSPPASLVMVFPVVTMYMTVRSTFMVRTETIRALEGLATEIDARDHYTAQHSERVAFYAGRMAQGLGRFTPQQMDLIVRTARIHDVGKLNVPSGVLHKPGPLDEHEMAEMRRHAQHGADFVGRFSDYRDGRDFILYHHERYDGAGYPHGLRGEQIPLGARIMAVADAFDAMTSNRPYRPAMSYERAIFELRRMSGKQFDPEVVAAFERAVRPDDLTTTREPGRTFVPQTVELSTAQA